jgi:hypothetical protein
VQGLAARTLWSLALGGLVGLVVDLAIRQVRRGYFLYLIIGGLLLGSGMAAAVGLEPLWVGLVAGAWVLNATLYRVALMHMVQRVHTLMKMGLAFTAGGLVGSGLLRQGPDASAFWWMLLVMVVLLPAARAASRPLLSRLLERSTRRRLAGETGLQEQESLSLLLAVLLLGLLPRETGLAVLAAVLVRPLVLALASSVLERLGMPRPVAEQGNRPPG